MAAYSEVRSKHATLTTTTVDTVVLTGSHAKVQIINHNASTAMYANVAVNGGTPSAVTSAVDDSYVIPPNGVLTLRSGGVGFSASIIGNGNAYSVVGYSSPSDDLTFTGAAAA